MSPTAPARTEPETGGPTRTPRSEITSIIPPARREKCGVEPWMAWDISTSTLWNAAPGAPDWNDASRTGGRRELMTEVAKQLVTYLEGLDSEAAAEQAGGSDEKGGLLTFFFGSGSSEGHDLNSSNFDRVVGGVEWGGTTHIMEAWDQAVGEYEDEFGDKPLEEQPVQLGIILTDGELDDMAKFGDVLRTAGPKRVFLVAIFGYDEDAENPRHTACINQYTKIAKEVQQADKHGKQYIFVISFDSVTNPKEAAEDLMVAVS